MHSFVGVPKKLFSEPRKWWIGTRNPWGISIYGMLTKRMLENLRKLKEINNKLRKQIRNRLGADLEDLSFDQLRNPEDEIINSSALIRERKLIADLKGF
ncbi:floral homeotic protein DEFICIENS-like [Senna tora]|uniref:Floral homeotic protein DEFICIENS-like n=1 Tax=Senna tora TaxID=362788 RepID=A0A835CEH7_9FABA|nr:floral homeotic protein DEFICIENS-like [Senna tora]